MLTQQAISSARLNHRIGQTMQVLVETVDGQTAVGRSYADAPEIDGLVHIDDAASLQAGDFCEVDITAADEYDLYATPRSQLCSS